MQKKQKIQFVVLLVLIAALTGAYFSIQSYNEKQEQKEEQEEEAAIITLTSFGPESVTRISYDYADTEYQFEKDGDTWKSVENEKLTLDQDAFESFLESAGSIQAASEVEAQEDTDYGFDKPLRTVEVTTTNGTSSLIFGAKNEMLGQYYAKTSESSKIYLVEESVYTTFEKTAEDFEAEDTDTETEIEVEDTDTETEIEVEDTDTETEIEAEDTDTETEIEVEDTDTETE